MTDQAIPVAAPAAANKAALSSAKPRIAYIDIAKCFAMVLIVLGHLTITAWGAGIPSQVRDVCYSCNVQAFFILSGYFFNPAKAFGLRKNLKHLLGPYLCSGLLLILFAMLFSALLDPGHSLLSVAGGWLGATLYGVGCSGQPTWFSVLPVGGLWFLLALFIGKALLWWSWRLPCPSVLRRGLAAHRDLIMPSIVAVLLFVISSVSVSWTFLPFSIQPGMGAVLWLMLGIILKRSHFLEKMTWPVILSALVLWISGILMPSPGAYPVWCSYPHGAFDVLVGLAGTICLLALGRSIERHCRRLTIFLAMCGRNTLAFFCFHIIDIDVFPIILMETPIVALSGIPFGPITVVLQSLVALVLSLLMYLLPRPIAALYFPQKTTKVRKGAKSAS
ncbi:MAG: acyltransferase [Coriobacteriales bacterium]|jgi:fucose 4-O-acetylase-like acetyltransferase|nr:acyltransferase [Coriobacteriales bacterium]